MTDRPNPGKPASIAKGVILALHAAMAGGFAVAWLLADENTYIFHQVAGYTVLAAAAIRFLLGLAAPQTSPLRFRRPDPIAAISWLSAMLRADPQARRSRSPVLAILAPVMASALLLAAASGDLAHHFAWLEEMHEAMAEAVLTLVIAHLALVFTLRWLQPSPPRAPGKNERERPVAAGKSAIRQTAPSAGRGVA